MEIQKSTNLRSINTMMNQCYTKGDVKRGDTYRILWLEMKEQDLLEKLDKIRKEKHMLQTKM